MRILSYSFETVTRMDAPISLHDFVLRCQPLSSPTQTVLDAQTIVRPGASIARQRDGFGNLLQIGRIVEAHDEFRFLSSGLVMVDANDARPEEADPIYRRPSRLTGVTRAMVDFSADVLRVSRNLPPFEKARSLSRALYARLTYEPGATKVSTSAGEAFELGRGVCQDYAHILIGLLRHEGVAARYVNGFMEGEGATHAWVEVHDGTRWRGIDVTNDKLVDDSYIVLSRGRDFADCPIEAGVFRGDAAQEQSVSVVVRANQAEDAGARPFV